MRTNKRLHSVILASAALILFLIFVLSAASAATEKITSPTITETQITTSGSAESPAIYGDKIVWIDWRNDKSDLYMYDISTSKETQLTNDEYSREWTAIYGDRIVYVGWITDGDDNWDIYMYNISTSKETRITTSKSWQQSPDIYGDKIVWQDTEDGNIYMYDISTSKETQITSSSAWDPDIYSDRIVWTDWRSGSDTSDIYMFNTSTKKETRITTSGSAQDPDIYGNRIVWKDRRNVDGEIYMFDLSTKKETLIANYTWHPAIYGDRIVWADGRNGWTDIYMYNISTKEETQITTGDSWQENPTIYGNRIVWQDYRNGENKPDIYMATILREEPEPIPPVANFSANLTSGKVPLTVAFTDKSTGTPTKWNWSFGDGTNSTKQNPAHKYSKAGKYTVSLTVKNAAGSNTTTKTDYIKVVTKPVASFSAKPTSGKAPLTVAFTDKSTGTPTKWKWSFGDGKNSTQQNPKHQYLQEGNYKVTLTVTNAAGSSTTIKTNYIKVITNTRPGIYSENK